MIGVTIGIGGDWPEIATLAARRMERMTGVSCEVIGKDEIGCAHPSWLKCHVAKLFPEADSFLLFDADILCLAEWSPERIFKQMKRRFCAVPDRNHPIVYDECVAHGLPFPDWYVNGGLTIFGREHQPLWDAVWVKHPRHGRWLEQTALNKSIQELAIETVRLPRLFNMMPNLDADCRGSRFSLTELREQGVVNFHFADCGGNGAPILALQKELAFDL